MQNALSFHIEDVISRMRPTKLSDGKIKFEGWARMALPIRSCKVPALLLCGWVGLLAEVSCSVKYS
jgi:hypothetical protein